MPVGVGGQQAVGGQHGLVRPAVQVLPVCADRGIIHQPGGLEGGRIGHADADVLRHAPVQGLVFVGGTGPVQREKNSQPRGLGGVFAGGVGAVAAPKAVQTAQHVLRASGGDMVQVQCQQVPSGDGSGLAAGPVQGPADKAAHVFEVVLLGLFHGQIAAPGLGPPYGRSQPGIELREQQRLGLPAYGPAAGARGYRNLSVKPHVWAS